MTDKQRIAELERKLELSRKINTDLLFEAEKDHAETCRKAIVCLQFIMDDCNDPNATKAEIKKYANGVKNGLEVIQNTYKRS